MTGVGAASLTGAAAGLNSRTSASMILLLGPVPTTWERSIPLSAATCLARGLATILPLEEEED